MISVNCLLREMVYKLQQNILKRSAGFLTFDYHGFCKIWGKNEQSVFPPFGLGNSVKIFWNLLPFANLNIVNFSLGIEIYESS